MNNFFQQYQYFFLNISFLEYFSKFNHNPVLTFFLPNSTQYFPEHDNQAPEVLMPYDNCFKTIPVFWTHIFHQPFNYLRKFCGIKVEYEIHHPNKDLNLRQDPNHDTTWELMDWIINETRDRAFFSIRDDSEGPLDDSLESITERVENIKKWLIHRYGPNAFCKLVNMYCRKLNTCQNPQHEKIHNILSRHPLAQTDAEFWNRTYDVHMVRFKRIESVIPEVGDLYAGCDPNQQYPSRYHPSVFTKRYSEVFMRVMYHRVGPRHLLKLINEVIKNKFGFIDKQVVSGAEYTIDQLREYVYYSRGDHMWYTRNVGVGRNKMITIGLHDGFGNMINGTDINSEEKSPLIVDLKTNTPQPDIEFIIVNNPTKEHYDRRVDWLNRSSNREKMFWFKGFFYMKPFFYHYKKVANYLVGFELFKKHFRNLPDEIIDRIFFEYCLGYNGTDVFESAKKIVTKTPPEYYAAYEKLVEHGSANFANNTLSYDQIKDINRIFAIDFVTKPNYRFGTAYRSVSKTNTYYPRYMETAEQAQRFASNTLPCWADHYDQYECR